MMTLTPFEIWIVAFFTLALFSFLYKDNPIYKIAEHIFAPLGMKSAGFVDDAQAWGARFPTGYGRSMQGGLPFVAPRWQLGAAIYTGGIYATATDLARFCATFMRDDSPILSAGSIRRMIHPAAMGDTTLGWWRGWHAGHANYGHAGAHVGFISAALFVPEFKLAVAVQANRWNPIFDTEDSTHIARELLAQLIPEVKRCQHNFDPSTVVLEQYEGLYILPGDYASAEVIARDGLLHITLHGVEAEPFHFVPVAPHEFGPPGTQIPARRNGTYRCFR